MPGLHRYRDRASFFRYVPCLLSLLHALTRRGRYGRCEKVHFGALMNAGKKFTYVESGRWKIVISGGDVANLKAEHIEHIGMRLLDRSTSSACDLPAAPAIMPQKLITDRPWTDTRVVEEGV